MEYLEISARVKTLLLSCLGLVIAIFVGMNVGNSNYMMLVMVTAAIVVASLGLLSSTFLWLLTIGSLFLAGTFPILGGSFTPFQILVMMALAKFVVGDMVLRRVRFNVGDRVDLLMIAGFMGVLTIHAMHDRFGMRFLGSNVWGGRNYINIYLGLAAFFAIQSVPVEAAEWRKLPYVLLAVTGFDLTIGVVTTLLPSLIYVIYPFYSAVSRTAIEEVVTGSSAEAVRLGAVGGFGLVLITLILATTSLGSLFHPRNFWRAVAFGLGFLAVIFSSFRSTVFYALVIALLAGIRDLRFRVLLLAPALALALLSVSFFNSYIAELPKAIQRSMTFVPGDWDLDMKQDAKGSNEFRRDIWALWWADYFPAHPLLGRGFGFRSEWGEQSVYKFDPEANHQTVEVGNIHNGFLAALDTFGVIGTFFFVLWNVRLLTLCFKVPFGRGDPADMPLRFVALYFGAAILCYWTGAANVGAFLPQEFALAGLLLRFRQTSLAPAPAAPAFQSRVARPLLPRPVPTRG